MPYNICNGLQYLAVVAEIPHLWVIREEVAGTHVCGPAALLLSMPQARNMAFVSYRICHSFHKPHDIRLIRHMTSAPYTI